MEPSNLCVGGTEANQMWKPSMGVSYVELRDPRATRERNSDVGSQHVDLLNGAE